MYNYLYKHISYLFLSLSLLFFISYFVTQYFQNKNHTYAEETERLSSRIKIQSVKIHDLAEIADNIIKNNPVGYWNKLDSILEPTPYDCFVIENYHINYWNTNKLDERFLRGLLSDSQVHIANLPTGWYLYTSCKTNNGNLYILDLIKASYLVSNEFLPNEINPKYINISNIKFTTKANEASNIIYNAKGDFLLGTKRILTNINSTNVPISAFILYLLSYIFLILFILICFHNSKHIKYNSIFKFSAFVLCSILIRLTDLYFNITSSLCNNPIFTIKLFNVPLSHTEGDMFLNISLLIIFSIAAYIFLSKSRINLSPTKIILKYTLLWAAILINLFILYQITYDQNISFYSDNLLNNENLIVVILIALGLNISMYYAFITYLNSFDDKKVPFFIPYLITFSGISIAYLVSDIHISIIIVTLVISFVLIILKQVIWKYFTDLFLNHIILLTLLASVSSIIINSSYNIKNENYQATIAQKLSVTNDIEFEVSFENIITKIISDKYLSQVLTQDTSISDLIIGEYIKSKYFLNQLNKYDIQITNCGENELLEIQPEGEIYECEDYFNTLIEEITIPVVDSTLFLFNSETESIYYIAKLPIVVNDNLLRNLYVEFVSSHVPEGLGYAELLIDKQQSTLNLSRYSFAKYSKNHLTYKFGDFAYSTSSSFSNNFKTETFINLNNYKHYLIHISGDNYLIVSRELTSTSMKIVVFSIIFIILALFSVLIYLIIYAKKAFDLLRLNFKTRLQTFVITTLTLTFILVAITTLIFIEESNRTQLEKQLTEKANSVLIELQHKLSAATNLESQDAKLLHQLLRKFSLVFFSDINLYDKSGYLIATSRPEIFEKKLLSTYINPKAYRAIFFANNLNFITEENIGDLNYYSAYVPLNLNNDAPIGVVNLPYFARQTEFTKSYYVMLSYLINIYVIVGIIGALIAIIFSRYLTRPLVMLQKSLATIRIDKHNEKISWNKNDEIGMLIHEYNRMVDKLEQSADLLKHSERESAWREVARQIAHEIKNPLTPMKLNVQYLKKSFINDDPEFSSKINSISKSLIEQIDTLDNVAEMFSDFAKSKSHDFVVVNLKIILDSSINLFNKNENVNISLKCENVNTDLFTLGFEKDILRAINNILNNAIQAIDKKTDGEINIIVQKDSRYIKIAISDNGKGISDDMKIKIFQPYFTTKTSGTGLGLAIVKNIMTEIGGEVYFESNDNQPGTTFYLVFPEA